jgi:hypothetical protein
LNSIRSLGKLRCDFVERLGPLKMSRVPDNNESSDPSGSRPRKIGCFLPDGVDLQTWAVESRAYYEHVTNLYETSYALGSWGNASAFLHLLDLYTTDVMIKLPSRPLSNPGDSEPSLGSQLSSRCPTEADPLLRTLARMFIITTWVCSPLKTTDS